MSYQVIARKWRPQTFAEMVGQNHITQTLGNALKSGRVHHALLFTGPRGTGKTSSARILAKALRCPNAVDFVPCNVCSSCVEISQSRSMDVQELDAASNNSVDDVRRLLDGVMSSPSSGRWKIYIIDEVHMLSSSAFNALLKTLEEPPAHVLFILATTEVQKIPETILSRCLRFDFKRISTRQIMEHLKNICDSEKVSADEESLWLIARQGDGSMRDSLSLLDQVITFSNGLLNKETVTRVLGLTDRSLLFDVLNNLLTRDSHGMLKVLEKFSVSGTEPRLFANELLETIRHLLVIKISGSEMNSLLELPDSELKFLAELGAQMSEEELHLLFDMALKGAGDIPRAQDPRLVLEVLLLRMASAPRLVDLQSLLGGVAKPASATAASAQPRGELRPSVKVVTVPVVSATASAAAVPAKAVPPASKVAMPTPQAQPVAAATHATPATPAPVSPPKKILAQGKDAADRWRHFVELCRAEDGIFAAKIESLLFNGETEKTLRLSIPPKMVFLKDQLEAPETRKKLKAFIDSFWGEGYSFEVISSRESITGTSAQTLSAQRQKETDEELKVRINQHPLVQAAQKVFPGEIKSITPVKAKENDKEGARK